MSDKLAEVLIAAALGVAAKYQGGAVPQAGAVPPKAIATSTAQTAKPAATAAKPAATTAKPTAAKPAATKPAAAAPAAKVGKYDANQVRDLVRRVATHEALGKLEAAAILQEEGGVQQVSQLKPADFDKVAEACNDALATAGGQGNDEEAPVEEFDPTA